MHSYGNEGPAEIPGGRAPCVVATATTPEPGGDGEDEIRLPRRVLACLCAAAGVALADVEPFTHLGAQAGLRPEQARLSLLPVRVHTLGRFALAKLGHAVVFNGKSPHKPIELLQALIALGGRDVHTDLLMDAVWADDESADPHNLFSNTLHRLRHLLQCDEALSLRDGKLTLNASHCWVDAWAFDRLSGLHAALPAPAAAQQALHLYQGHFLQLEAARPWLHAYRERLRSRFHRLVATEGARLEAQSRWRDAVTIYQRGIEIDPLAEGLYQRLMGCHRAQGAQAEVLRVYLRCREQLLVGLGVEPSAATDAIRRGARSADSGSPP